MADDWATTDKRRMLHAVYRIGDLPGTVKFYREQLGMQVRLAVAEWSAPVCFTMQLLRDSHLSHR